MGERGPPDRTRGTVRETWTPGAERFANRCAEVDRGNRFADRLDTVRSADRSRRRRRVAGSAAGAALAFVVAGIALSWQGVGLVAIAVVLAAAVRRAVDGLARRRGARAWDWHARRHRLIGDPSARVRALDGPPGGHPPGGGAGRRQA